MGEKESKFQDPAMRSLDVYEINKLMDENIQKNIQERSNTNGKPPTERKYTEYRRQTQEQKRRNWENPRNRYQDRNYSGENNYRRNNYVGNRPPYQQGNTEWGRRPDRFSGKCRIHEGRHEYYEC